MRRLAHLLGVSRLLPVALACVLCGTGARTAAAQNLGPFRQFLAIEPFYEYTRHDNGSAAAHGTTNLDGYGARLWINLEPFHLIPRGSIALSSSYTPSQNESANGKSTAWQYGAEYDQFLVHRPLGGIIDPFLSIGYSRYRVSQGDAEETYNGLPLGGGIRIPIPNRFEIRADVKDLLLFNTPTGANGSDRTTNNLQAQVGLGLTF